MILNISIHPLQIYYTISSLSESNNIGYDTEEGSVEVAADIFEHSFMKETMKPNSRYDFNMTASTVVGESEQCECSNVYCTTKPGGWYFVWAFMVLPPN